MRRMSSAKTVFTSPSGREAGEEGDVLQVIDGGEDAELRELGDARDEAELDETFVGLQRKKVWIPMGYLLLVNQLQILGRGLGDADGQTGLAEEDDDNAVAADAFDFTLYATEGAAKDADPLTDFIKEVAVGKWNALMIGVGQVCSSDKILHGCIGNIDDLIPLRWVERGS